MSDGTEKQKFEYSTEEKELELTNENLPHWKTVVDKLFARCGWKSNGNYTDCLSDKEWLDYVDMTPAEYLLEEMSCAQ